MNKNRLYEAIMKDVSKSVRKHLNEISSGLVDRAISKAKERLSEPKLAPKARRELKRQLNVFNKYSEDNFTWESDYEFLVDAIMAFYNHFDSEIVQNFLDDNGYDYDETYNTQYNINWNNIKTKMKNLYNYLNQYNWDNAIATRIEYLSCVYDNIAYNENWYNYSWAEEDYPDTDGREPDEENFNDYGDMLKDIKYYYKNDVVNLFEELPEELLKFMSGMLMDFFLWDGFGLYE